ncbi:transcriptional repressor [Helicobacter saguini]|uniref:Transcriptional repressor n=1 Tax=Helicobacter saguini TaxID=1548018 RepID=A0A347VSD5_9HELI|nr:Fur family transcriptional regulator [Helicobacter saguini]MWV62551.1 transcriptional repressor [Helicobacter saguini]MWV66775.1 transcriptional repressor [Helicobacter saguini]MWV69126.1 transcriptional repressor [Helicobacter saguini]MWV71319.1 transcriptional repressor [Helicobacter saguini]TLD94171.1 transcriptional repressor [Helicobacter saguini]
MNFEKELKAKRLKVTPQRLAILREIESKGHTTIEGIYENILENYPSTSLTTIYKNVTIMCESDILSEVKAPGYKQRYEIKQQKHVHVMCEKCGKLQDLYINYSNLQNECEAMSGYKLDSLSAVFTGVCSECRE